MEAEKEPLVIPIEELDQPTLRAVIEEFVTRDGTELSDSGTMIAAVEKQLRQGVAQIVFDRESESCTIQNKK